MRPSEADSPTRYQTVTIRLSESELAEWRLLASEDGLPLARMVRRSVRERLALREALRLEQERFERGR